MDHALHLRHRLALRAAFNTGCRHKPELALVVNLWRCWRAGNGLCAS
jgi:hypothetical protein